MGIVDFVKGVGVVTFLRHFVKNHPAGEYAKDAANELDKILDNEVGDKRSEVIQETVLPWLDEWYVTFRKTITKN